MGSLSSFQQQKSRPSITAQSSFVPQVRPSILVPSPSLDPTPFPQVSSEHARQFREGIERMSIFPGEQNAAPPAYGGQRTGDAVQRKRSLMKQMIQQQGMNEMQKQHLPQKKNMTGLPDALKAGVESLSGLSLDDVHVHYHSSKPAQVQALAYTQGTEIHVGPGQERHLAHEAWHVVQQKQGRVKPTLQAKGMKINDEEGLEREAEIMGTMAATEQSAKKPLARFAETASRTHDSPIQCLLDKEVKINTFCDDVEANQHDQELKKALTSLLAAAKRSKLSIEYDWLVARVKRISGINAKKVNKLKESLDKEIAEITDEKLSGPRGHMLTRHVMVDKEHQESRLAGGLERATRVDTGKQYGVHYHSYLKKLDASAPGVIKQHIEAVSSKVLDIMTEPDYGFAMLSNNAAKRDFLRDMIETPQVIEEKDYTITANWRIQVTGAGIVSLTCEPSILSKDTFRKIITEKDKDGQVVESQAHEPVTMYWGSNRFVIRGLTPTTTKGDLADKIEELDFKLGVTQY